MSAFASAMDISLEELDPIETPEMSGEEVLLYSLLAFAGGVILGAAIAT
ncbi:hypothetical protein J2W22_000369 [Sphingomonas kyeonggiensis]|nr:hypothetical protein [Sphingomonas kyeonggiensis]MDQ0248322.1 hypothetical protein [Sphingomonas kyeonggiensis]